LSVDRGRVISPGRVNLLGEHVDYNDGVVLPVAIDRVVDIHFRRMEGKQITLYAYDLGEDCSFDADQLDRKTTLDGTPLPDWALYPAGVIWNLMRYDFQIEGFSADFRSNIPIGAGLSSSAAVEVGFAVVCEALGGWQLERMTMARICQEAEHEYVGVNCGLMDQFACACGVQEHALMLDTRSLAFRAIPLPRDTAIVIADSTLRRSLVTSAYNDRRKDCETAVAYFHEIDPSIRALRDVTPQWFLTAENKLPPDIFRHARHVVEEIARVDEAIRLLEKNDTEGFGKLMIQTHASLRDLYEVSSPELDMLAEGATAIEGCLGARLTGAGFAGCTVNLVRRDRVDPFIRQLRADYLAKTGLVASIFATRPVDGAHLS